MLNNIIYFRFCFVCIFTLLISCATQESSTTANRGDKDQQKNEFETIEFENIAETMGDLRELLIDLTAYQACERIKGRFSTLSAKGSSPEGSSEPAVGVFWVQDCTATQIDDKHLSIQLMGKGWRWVSREKSNVGAEFKIDGNVRFSVDITMIGTIDMDYTKQNHLITAWMIPTQPVEANFQVIDDVEVDTDSLWGSIVGGAATLFGKSPEQRAKDTISKKGSKKIESKLSHGLTLILDLCTGQRYTNFGKLAAGELPKHASPAQNKTFLVNNRAQLHSNSIVLSGPFESTQPVIAKINLEEGQNSVHAALVCKDEGKNIASEYLKGNSISEFQSLKEKVVRENTSIQLETDPEANCPVMLVLRSTKEQQSPVTVSYLVQHKNSTQKPLVSCE